LAQRRLQCVLFSVFVFKRIAIGMVGNLIVRLGREVSARHSLHSEYRIRKR